MKVCNSKLPFFMSYQFSCVKNKTIILVIRFKWFWLNRIHRLEEDYPKQR